MGYVSLTKDCIKFYWKKFFFLLTPLLLNFYAIKNKALTLLLTFTFLSVTSFSQTVKENIEKQMKDPKTSENAAKADV